MLPDCSADLPVYPLHDGKDVVWEEVPLSCSIRLDAYADGGPYRRQGIWVQCSDQPDLSLPRLDKAEGDCYQSPRLLMG